MCFHIAMTTAIYAGGISLTSYPVVCQAVSAQLYAALALSPVVCAFAAWSDCNVRQVGIALHYSSLSTLLWIGVSARVIYKEAVWRTPRQPEGEPAAVPTQRPMLRSVGEARRHLAFTSFSASARLLFGVREFTSKTDVGAVVAVTTQAVRHQSGPLCPSTEVLLLIRTRWRVTRRGAKEKVKGHRCESGAGEGRNA